MTTEPEKIPVDKAGNQPATQGYVQQVRSDLVALIKSEGEKTRQHLDVVAENIHKDVAGANQDELSLIKDQQLPDHEERIQDLEKHTELAQNWRSCHQPPSVPVKLAASRSFVAGGDEP